MLDNCIPWTIGARVCLFDLNFAVNSRLSNITSVTLYPCRNVEACMLFVHQLRVYENETSYE